MPVGFAGALLALFALAAALRLYDLGAESIWLDEAFSIEAARGSLDHLIAQTARDVHPPLYFVILHYWVALAGTSEAAARLPSVVFSLGIMAAAVALALRLFDRRTAIAAAALLAVSPFQVEFAQEARMYTLLALLGTLSIHTFLEAFLFAPARRGWVAAYAAVTTLMLYTHVYSLFIVAAEAAVVLLGALTARHRFRRAAWTWLAASTAAGLLYLPWVTTLLRQVARVQSGFWIPEQPWFAVLQPLLTYAGSTGAAVVLVALALWGAVRIARFPGPPLPRGMSVRTVLLVWLAAPVALPFIVSMLGSPIFLPKYTIAASVPFALLAGCGVAQLPGRAVRAGAVVLVACVSLAVLDAYYRTPRKDGWREAVSRLEAQAAPGDLVLVYRNFNLGPVEYYARRADVDRAGLYFESPGDAGEVDAVVERAIADRRRVWLVTRTAETATPTILAALERSFDERSFTNSQQIETYLFEREL